MPLPRSGAPSPGQALQVGVMEVGRSGCGSLSGSFASFDLLSTPEAKNKLKTKLPISVCVSVTPKCVMVRRKGK